MKSNPFKAARGYLKFAMPATWCALAASVGSTLCLALLFPILYLFVDLLVNQGHAASYASLSSVQQRDFREEMDALVMSAVPDAENPKPLPSINLTWEQRWQQANYDYLERRVGKEAAETYMPQTMEFADDKAIKDVPTGKSIGLLSVVIHERGRRTGWLLAWIARWNHWAWRASDSVNTAYLTGLFVIAFLLAAMRGLLENISAHTAALATITAGTRLRRAVHTHGYRLTALATRPEARAEAGELITRRIEHIQDGLQAHLTSGVRGPLLTLLMSVVILLSGNPWLSVSLLVLAALVWLLIGQTAEWYSRDARQAESRAKARMAMMRESLSIMSLVKAYLMERFSQTRFERHMTDLSNSTWRRQRGEALSRPTLYSVISLVGIAMLYLSGRVVLAGELSLAGLVLKGSALGILAYAVNRWYAARLRINRARNSAADVFEFLDRRGESGQGLNAEFLPPMKRQIEFRGVSLRESGTGKMALEDVTMTIAAGSRVAVVASESFEGRAIAHLITRFTDPTAGEIRIDGKNIRWVTYESVRAQTAIVFEQSLTFSDSVMNNIGCGDAAFTMPQIIDAAKAAHAHQFIQRLPYGYQTHIGDGGVSLRPGQRFRIALARALLRDPSLIIIEEPSEPLDPDSLVLIDDTIERIRKTHTILFLARRASTIKNADQVYVIRGGKLVASGTHEDLLRESESYRSFQLKTELTTG